MPNRRGNSISQAGNSPRTAKPGSAAVTAFETLLGTGAGGADAQAAAIEQLRASPFYQSLYRTGEEAVLQNASATGGIRGGNTERGLADFGADTLAKTIDRQLASLGGLGEMGLGAVGELGRFGAAKAGAVSDLLTQQGQAKAGDILARGGLSAGIWQNIGGLADSAASIIGGGMGGGFGSALSQLGGGGAVSGPGSWFAGSQSQVAPSPPSWLMNYSDPGRMQLGGGLGGTGTINWGG